MFTVIYRIILSTNFLHDYIYTIRVTHRLVINQSSFTEVIDRAYSYSYTKLHERYTLRVGKRKDAVEKSYRTPLRLRGYYLYRKVALTFGIHCQQSNVCSHEQHLVREITLAWRRIRSHAKRLSHLTTRQLFSLNVQIESISLNEDNAVCLTCCLNTYREKRVSTVSYPSGF